MGSAVVLHQSAAAHGAMGFVGLRYSIHESANSHAHATNCRYEHQRHDAKPQNPENSICHKGTHPSSSVTASRVEGSALLTDSGSPYRAEMSEAISERDRLSGSKSNTAMHSRNKRQRGREQRATAREK